MTLEFTITGDTAKINNTGMTRYKCILCGKMTEGAYEYPLKSTTIISECCEVGRFGTLWFPVFKGSGLLRDLLPCEYDLFMRYMELKTMF